MRRLSDATVQGRAITLELEGEAVPAVEGEPLACALAAAGRGAFTCGPGAGARRGAFCFSATCAQCLLRVDGVPNVFACRTPARLGMRLEWQLQCAPTREALLGAFDWLMPQGLLAGAPLTDAALASVVTELASLGLRPDREPPPLLPARELRTRVAVAGGGAAGLAAAAVLGAHGVPFLLFEREPHVGGRLRHGPPEPGAPRIIDPGELPTSALRRSSAVLALQQDAAGRYLLVLGLEPMGVRVTKVYAERFLLAVGGPPARLDFPGSTLPGVYAARALSRLVRLHGLVPETAAFVGWGPELYGAARLCAEHGTEVRAVVDLRGPPPPDAPFRSRIGREPEALGAEAVEAFAFTAEGAGRQRFPCGTVGVAVPPLPALELAVQGGARVRSEGEGRPRAIEADDEGRTAAADVRVAGDMVGCVSTLEAAHGGERAAEGILRDLR
ncbi:ferredoxin [Aggregicoccus sp. 17bor-14]|uniref:(2Fe-2S)-binding protein n=1 Tax=Myxococcaceae TaxID=31 RepID=UPI00129CF319|nr:MULTISPECIES: (2Fe-2S)-binding protein [Myxococcaceae]MBF5040956.1 (2Fe-2S)-binding protein [Simulacricoccus sp. 17bor-14]MRI86744.1 ferredoxin [Aggregicoccus sp. 17bor-14]